MNSIAQWAARWGVSCAAVTDLMRVLGAACPPDSPPAGPDQTEAGLQSAVRLEAARRGARLFRNNSGACMDESGRMIRYGLGNDSKRVNEVMKSSDLIGVWPYQVQPADIGRTLGIFTAMEIKAPSWQFRIRDKRAIAQLNFIKLITSLGGYGRFVTSLEDLNER